MKKWIALILALVMAAGMLVGCSQEQETADTGSEGASTEGATSEGSTAEDAYAVSGNITLGTASSTGALPVTLAVDISVPWLKDRVETAGMKSA